MAKKSLDEEVDVIIITECLTLEYTFLKYFVWLSGMYA